MEGLVPRRSRPRWGLGCVLTMHVTICVHMIIFRRRWAGRGAAGIRRGSPRRLTPLVRWSVALTRRCAKVAKLIKEAWEWHIANP